MNVYFASPIDQMRVVPEHVAAISNTILNSLTKEGYVVYNPQSAFKVGQDTKPHAASSILAVNQYALESSDAMVAYLPEGVPSIGVPIEIDRAANLGIPVLVITNVKSWALPINLSNVRVSEVWLPTFTNWLEEEIGKHAGPEEPLYPLPYTLEPNAYPPIRGYSDDAGLDLVASADVVVPALGFADIPSGVAVQLPEWSWGMITGRSSTLRKRGLLVPLGVIDTGYRGELFSSCWNLTNYPVEVKKGERVAQLIIIDNCTMDVELINVEQLSESERGSNGFGSTGK